MCMLNRLHKVVGLELNNASSFLKLKLNLVQTGKD